MGRCWYPTTAGTESGRSATWHGGKKLNLPAFFRCRGEAMNTSIASRAVGGLIVMFVGVAVGVAMAQSAPSGQAPAPQAGRGAPPAPTPPCGPNLPGDVKNVA